MAQADRLLGTYLHLARASALRRRPMVRDKLLVLAGVIAAEMGLDEISARCRQKVLAHNRRHIVRRWRTLAEALADERFLSYLKQLRRRYTPEKAEHMLSSLGIELARERALYVSDHEYAASILETTPDGALTAAQVQQVARVLSPRRSEHRGVASAMVFRDVLIDWGPYALGLLILGLLAAVWTASH